MEGDSTGEILAPKRIYTRRNPSPNPPKVVEDPERILRRSNNKADKGIFHLQGSLSLPVEGIKDINDIIFDQKFEQTLFRSKSSLDLSQVIFGPKDSFLLIQLSSLLSPHLFQFSLRPKLPKVYIYL